jgi:anti-sigma-K factor RskA
MSAQAEQLTDFERRSRLVLEESVLRIDGRVRSRLNQARQRAIAATSTRHRAVFWRFFSLVPTTAGAVAAALVVAMMLWHRGPEPQLAKVSGDSHPPMEVMDLLADGEGLDLVQDGDGSGSFYEWAADQSEAGGNETDT